MLEIKLRAASILAKLSILLNYRPDPGVPPSLSQGSELAGPHWKDKVGGRRETWFRGLEAQDCKVNPKRKCIHQPQNKPNLSLALGAAISLRTLEDPKKRRMFKSLTQRSSSTYTQPSYVPSVFLRDYPAR